MKIEIDFKKIKDWNAFHKTFKNIMGFPEFYGNNGNAWIDCMSYIDDPNSGMSRVVIREGESLEIAVNNMENSIVKNPDIVLGFMVLVVSVNQRFIESGTQTRLLINAT